ncbi:hypothetical protein PGN35_000525 [Nodosilinea sp. PGN35]|uniref:hypothetical protein n=1 Tax=Nodosilinea sp. PGN35 TaxID=3020489 RepID=UPI0023B25045|nr:hypothetical protein [Nodosilinea sp. TSF1-S3]MDF0369101.1 hypothetical protein [Nodosilinea sp. TSF1-S3]
MHNCPSCGYPCDCDGEDTYVYAEPFEGCQCQCELDEENEDGDFGDGYTLTPDDWPFIALNQWVLESYVSNLAAEADRPD